MKVRFYSHINSQCKKLESRFKSSRDRVQIKLQTTPVQLVLEDTACETRADGYKQCCGVTDTVRLGEHGFWFWPLDTDADPKPGLSVTA